MHRHEGDSAAGKLDLRTDRHAAANPPLAARRPKPAPIGFEAGHERTVKTDGTGHGIAMKPHRVPLVAIGRDLVLVTQAELYELDTIGKVMAELASHVGEAMSIARPNHTLVDLTKEYDVRPMPAQNPRNCLDMAETLNIPDADPNWSIGPLADGPTPAQFDFP